MHYFFKNPDIIQSPHFLPTRWSRNINNIPLMSAVFPGASGLSLTWHALSLLLPCFVHSAEPKSYFPQRAPLHLSSCSCPLITFQHCLWYPAQKIWRRPGDSITETKLKLETIKFKHNICFFKKARVLVKIYQRCYLPCSADLFLEVVFEESY